jgi:hypothetical protein
MIGIDEHECTHILDYQLIDEGRNTTEKERLGGTYDFLSCGCTDYYVKKGSTYFFRITHAEGKDWQSHNIEWRTHQEHSCCDL